MFLYIDIYKHLNKKMYTYNFFLTQSIDTQIMMITLFIGIIFLCNNIRNIKMYTQSIVYIDNESYMKNDIIHIGYAIIGLMIIASILNYVFYCIYGVGGIIVIIFDLIYDLITKTQLVKIQNVNNKNKNNINNNTVNTANTTDTEKNNDNCDDNCNDNSNKKND